MADRGNSMKTELIAEIEAAWAALHSYLAQLSEAQMTTVHDHQRWTVKDHLTHMAAWEESVVVFLQGRPRYEGLGVDESLYSSASFDDINDVIKQHYQALTLAQATAQLQAAHRRLMALLQPLTDADLSQSLRHFLPSSPVDDRRQAINIIRDNTSAHFSEHLVWIKALVSPRE